MDGAAPVSDDSNRASDNSAGRSLPEFPGEDFLAHAATQWMEKAEARFGSLLPVAQGKDPAAVLQIIDVELDDIPPLPAAHPQHERGSATGGAVTGIHRVVIPPRPLGAFLVTHAMLCYAVHCCPC